MTQKTDNPAAALARLKWAKIGPEERTKLARNMLKARWGKPRSKRKPSA